MMFPKSKLFFLIGQPSKQKNIQNRRGGGGGVWKLSSRKKLTLTVETSSNIGPNI